jgi:hypothetical protein
MKTFILKPLFIMLTLMCALSWFSSHAVYAQRDVSIPIKEITAFKDGHAFILHEGSAKTDASGNVIVDYVPIPILGTFWSYSVDSNPSLLSVTSGQHIVKIERTALTLGELLEANPGKDVIISERTLSNQPKVVYPATIIGIPFRDQKELYSIQTSDGGEKPIELGEVILLKTSEGTKAVTIGNIQDVTFKGPYNSILSVQEFRNQLIFNLDWKGRKPAAQTNMGLMYIQKGIRWIPSYKVTIDGNGNAAIKLQATLINELVDLNNVDVNLVVGVPSFSFKDTLDPMSLRQKAQSLSPYFNQGSADSLSNAVITQTARMREVPRRIEAEEQPVDLGPDVPTSGKTEDLYIFNAKNISLSKGTRMVIPITEFNARYEDVFTLDIPLMPPADVRRGFSSGQQTELARLLNEPKVMHKIRFTNKSPHPITTAPGLIVRNNQVLAQGMMSYTPVGAATDLDVTNAVDIQVKRSDVESRRIPNAVKRYSDEYTRVELDGEVELTNYRSQPVNLEINRYVLGNVDSANTNGKVEKLNVFEEGKPRMMEGTPLWWTWYSWPEWWSYFNGMSRIKWNVKLDPGKSIKLGYTWHYFWR